MSVFGGIAAGIGGALGGIVPTQEQTTGASVEVGEVTPDDENAKYQGPQTNAIYTDYVINNKYEYDRQTYMAGLTSPTPFNGQSAAFFQLASPTLLWVCDWTACRFGTQPEIPDPDSVGTDWVLLDVIPETSSLGLAPDGVSPLYRISGTYVYGHKNPTQQVYNQIAFGRPPWMQDAFSRTVPLTTLTPSLSVQAGAAGQSTASPGSPK